MAKNRNLKYQFHNAITSHFKEGMDKHSIKKIDHSNNKVYSYADRKNLIDTASELSNYLKEKHPEVKMLRDIQASHIQEFLDSKVNDCSDATLKQYASRIRKIETLAKETYHIKTSFSNVVVPSSTKNGGGKIRSVMCSDAQYEKLIHTTNQNLKNALILSKTFGTRCEENARLRFEDIKSNGILIVDSKGKRSRFIEATTDEQKQVLEQLRQQGSHGRICPIQKGSLEQAFNRECKKQGIEFENGAFHTLRKNFATKKYQEFREKGLTVQESLDAVSKQLGHGTNRNKLMRQYILCPIK